MFGGTPFSRSAERDLHDDASPSLLNDSGGSVGPAGSCGPGGVWCHAHALGALNAISHTPHLPCSEARAAALDLLVAAALDAYARGALRAAPGLSARLLTAAAAALGSPQDAGAAAALLGNLFMNAAMRGQVPPTACRAWLQDASTSGVQPAADICQAHTTP